MSLIAKIKALVTGWRHSEQGEAYRDASKQPEDRMGGGSPHDLAMSRYAGSFQDE